MTVESAHASLMTRASLGLPTSYVAPEGELEATIAKIFGRVFGIDQVGADDDFFDIGGDSLVAENLSMEILQQTGHEFPMSEFLEFPTPRKIAAAIEKKPGVGKQAPAAEVPLAAEDKARPPIFVVHGRGGYTMPAAQFRAALADGQKLRMFELPGIRGGKYYERIEDIAAAYIDQINQEYPRGPILLASFCAGGLIAIEMANQLAEKGRPVKHLVLCDPPVRRNGTLGVGTDKIDLQDGLRALLLHLLPRNLRLRYYELRWRKRGRKRFADQNLSATARAKLYAAYIDHHIRPYTGPVTVLTSRARFPAMRDGSQVASLLPNRTVHLVVERHGEITSEPRAAELMQEAFDAALAEG
jgi:thioesterase domain-containing protein/acyl carrier protein